MPSKRRRVIIVGNNSGRRSPPTSTTTGSPAMPTKPGKAQALGNAQAAAVTADLDEITTALRDTLCRFAELSSIWIKRPRMPCALMFTSSQAGQSH